MMMATLRRTMEWNRRYGTLTVISSMTLAIASHLNAVIGLKYTKSMPMDGGLDEELRMLLF